MCGIVCIVSFGKPVVDLEKARMCLHHVSHRGPDHSKELVLNVNSNGIYLGFSRLAIMDTNKSACQPYSQDNTHVICNGEIYNHDVLKENNKLRTMYQCDCEIIVPLYQKLVEETDNSTNSFVDLVTKYFDAEFALVLIDQNKKQLFAARDKYGVRPLFVGIDFTEQTVAFASELKALQTWEKMFIQPLDPKKLLSLDLSEDIAHIHTLDQLEPVSRSLATETIDKIRDDIRNLLTRAVSKRLHANRTIGFLLSGGLDSSLIVAIATRIVGVDNITCFSIGMEGSPDVEAAKKVVRYLGIKKHYIVGFTSEEGYAEIPNVIKSIESYDITTVRASTPQYLLAKFIKKRTDVRVLLSGEGSDEIHGSYRYFRDAPNAQEFHGETQRLLDELYLYDNLRTDRTMAAFGLEVRVPFLDMEYVRYIMNLSPELLMYRKEDHQMEKQLLRDSFRHYLPNDILYRSKEAFSDAVSSESVSWYKTVQEEVSKKYHPDVLSESTLEPKVESLEAYHYRKLFDEFYPNRSTVIPHYWLPKWQKDHISDPSATVLKCY